MQIVLMVLMVGFTLPGKDFQPVHISSVYMTSQECAAERNRLAAPNTVVECRALKGEVPDHLAHLTRGANEANRETN